MIHYSNRNQRHQHKLFYVIHLRSPWGERFSAPSESRRPTKTLLCTNHASVGGLIRRLFIKVIQRDMYILAIALQYAVQPTKLWHCRKRCFREFCRRGDDSHC